ncbi:MAG: hypothetical protein ACI97N_002080 [Cognaticolwellia sp.]|jgi:hypothetical protein
MQLSKKHWIYIVVTLGFITQILLSKELWYGESRLFFLVPMFKTLPLNIGNIGNMLLFIGLLLGLLIGVFYHKRYLLIGVLGFIAILFLQDITRIQAWSYQYFLLFFILFIDWKKTTKETLPALQYILIFTYFWSGFQKINPHYVDSVHPWLFSAYDWSKPLAESTVLAYGTAIIETVLGIGLMFRVTQKIAVIGAISMHILVLSMIGPWALDWNSVVYPWNIVMIFLLIILFWHKNDKKTESPKPFLLTPQSSIQWIILIAVGILPLFNILFNRFPETISMTMYNGATSELTVYFPENENPKCIPYEAKGDVYPALNGNLLSLDDWGVQELNVPVYDLPTYAQKFGKQFCDCVEDKLNSGIRVTNIKRWQTKDSKIIEWISCQDLK